MTISATAAVTVSAPGAKNNVPVTATVTLTNAGAAALTILAVTPTVGNSALTSGASSTSVNFAPVSLGTPQLVAGQLPTAAATNGTATVKFDVIPFEPHMIPSTYHFHRWKVGANVLVTDGTDTTWIIATPVSFAGLEYSYPYAATAGKLAFNQEGGDKSDLAFLIF